VLLPTGVVVARLYKDRHPRWFAAHTALNTWGALFAVAGYAVGLKLASMPPYALSEISAAVANVAAGNATSAEAKIARVTASGRRLEGRGISSATHSAVGTCAVALLVWQIILVTTLRPGNTGENKRSRRLWNLAHRWTGWGSTR
jgi:hypothetical protein